jgi:beta-alanine degradation protein BauB
LSGGSGAKLLQELKTAHSNGRVGTRLLSECDVARIWEVRLKPGQRLSFHRHVLNYFWTVLTAGIAHSRAADGTTKEIEYYRGDTKNLRYAKGEGMTHDLENVGTTELLLITVEFLDSENSPLLLPSAKWALSASNVPHES